MARRRCVVLFGDSRAADWSAPEVEGFRFVNRGIPGESSAQARGRFEAHVASLHPDVIVVQAGVNDLMALGVLPGEREVQATTVVANVIANVRQIVERATALGARVVVTTLFPLGAVPAADELPAAVEAVNAALRAMEGGRRAGAVSVLDAYAVLADDEGRTRPAYSLDLLHLTEAGYGRLNEALAAHLAGLEG